MASHSGVLRRADGNPLRADRDLQEGSVIFDGPVDEARAAFARQAWGVARAAYTAAVRILAEHPSAESVLQETLRAICRALEWKIAVLWNTDPLADVLRLAASWCEREELSEFVHESERYTFRKGIGLPGRVWATNEPTFVLIRVISEHPHS